MNSLGVSVITTIIPATAPSSSGLQVSVFSLQVAGAERILHTPMPAAYSRYTSRACICFMAVVPILICPALTWATPAITLVVA